MQDPYSGYSYPGYAESEPLGEPVYDGFGNPLGFQIPFISDIARGVGQAVSGLIPGVGQAVSGLIPGVGQAVSGLLPGFPGIPGFPGGAQPPPAPAFSQAFPGVQPWQISTGQANLLPRPFPSFRPPWPLGWQRPQLPYTGLGPRRLYMRCAVWPGPRGLVPAIAQGAAAQAAAMQAAAQQAAAAMGGRRRRRHRRRR
jgi:hypothetical protein